MFASKKNLAIVWNEVYLNKISSTWSLLTLSCCILGFWYCLHAFVCLIIWTENDKSFFLYLFFQICWSPLKDSCQNFSCWIYFFKSPQSPKWSQLTWDTPLGELAPPSDQRNIFLWISIFLCLLFLVITSIRHFFLTWKEYTVSTGSIQNHKIKITPNKMTPKALWIVLYIKPN